MAEYGTEAFKELWRQKGFFAAIDSSERHGKSTAADFRRMNSRLMREKIAEMRKELARMQAVVDRLDHVTMAGATGGKVEQSPLERNVVELGGWIASALESYVSLYFYVSEPALRRIYGFMKPQTMDSATHPSRNSS